MGFITSTDDALRTSEYEEEPVSTFEPGVFHYLNPGESVEVPQLQQGASEYSDFVRHSLRAIAVGLGISYESLSGDLSQGSYSQARQALLADREVWRAHQRHVIRAFCQPIYEAWLGAAVLSRAVPLPDYELNPSRYEQPLWLPRGWKWIDPKNDIAAYTEALAAGMISLTEVIQENGGDIEKVFLARKAEEELAASIGLSSFPSAAEKAAPPKPGVEAQQEEDSEPEDDTED
jgi:lambda family phage portal protein